MPEDGRPQVVHDALPDLIRQQRLDHAEDTGRNRDRDHSGGGHRQRARVVLRDRLEHALEQERRHDAERRRADDQQEQAPEPQPVGGEQRADTAQVRRPQSWVRGPLRRFFGRIQELAHSIEITHAAAVLVLLARGLAL
jgi:hypothetical protein